MKNIIKLVVTLTLVLTIMMGFKFNTSDVIAEEYTVEEMLVYAMQDEINAKSMYDLAIEEFGELQIFQNISNAEQNHIDMLTPLLEKYNVAIDYQVNDIQLPTSLEEMYMLGIEAEKNNIALYEEFLTYENIPNEVAEVFKKLINASNKHLQAFENQLDGNYKLFRNSNEKCNRQSKSLNNNFDGFQTNNKKDNDEDDRREDCKKRNKY